MIHKALLFAGLCAFSVTLFAQPIPVELRQISSGTTSGPVWQLFRGDQPYFIKGAGGTDSLAALKAAGGNSIRTWGGVKRDLLDQAHALGLTVTVGIWLGHERHGFDYDNPQQVQAQLNQVRETVLRLKDHPAVLMWGVGNEMEGFAEGNNPAIWKAVNDAAELIKTLDPHHPTMTVTAFVHGERIEYVHRRCPAIDIHGINAYGKGAEAVPRLLQEGKASKPFVLTEFGPMGAWDGPKTSWGAPYEQTSTTKAESYRRIYQNSVVAPVGKSLGSYAFVWGHKMEATETWFGMFLANGKRTAAIETMTELWSGNKASNLAPTVNPIVLESGTPMSTKEAIDVMVEPGSKQTFSTVAIDPEGEPLQVQWLLKPEDAEHVTGGDFRPTPKAIDGAIVEAQLGRAEVRMPTDPGPYRLFYYVYDQAGNAATANVPLLVKGQITTRLPFAVYEEQLEHMPWVPSGFMGGIEQLSIDGSANEQPYEGKAAVKIRYEGKFGWAGVAWQQPANNWGDQEGGVDLTGATELELWARGEYGGEQVSFGVGLIGPDKPHPDSGITKVDDIVLSHQWQRYTVPIEHLDLSSIKTGLVVTMTGRSTPVTIYLDSIRFKP